MVLFTVYWVVLERHVERFDQFAINAPSSIILGSRDRTLTAIDCRKERLRCWAARYFPLSEKEKKKYREVFNRTTLITYQHDGLLARLPKLARSSESSKTAQRNAGTIEHHYRTLALLAPSFGRTKLPGLINQRAADCDGPHMRFSLSNLQQF